MKYDVTFTEQAENAAGQLDRIEEKILSLGEYPEKFRQYEREPWKSRNTRVVPVDNYAIFYIPDKTKKLVTVIRVDRKSTRLNSSHKHRSRMPSSA